MAAIRRILHATDFSRASRAAFAKAVEMAKANRAELLLLHVLAPLTPIVAAGEGYMPPDTYEKIEASTRAAAQKQLDALVAAARKSRVRATGLLAEGSPAEQIVRVAKSKRADLIVLGTHGRTGLARFLVGSVASRVVSMAPLPVLTVRGSAR